MLFGILGIIALALLVGYLVLLFMASTFVFSRGLFALALAALLQTNLKLVEDGGFMNYLAWAIVIWIVVYFLSSYPRIKVALHFFCSVTLSYGVMLIVVSIVGGLFSIGAEEAFAISLVYDIVMKVICVGVSVMGMFGQFEEGTYDLSDKPLTVIFDRVFASVFYGCSVVAIVFLNAQGWDIPDWAMLILFVVGTVACYFADIMWGGKKIFQIPDKIKIIMPR